jgi:hypothetical protein
VRAQLTLLILSLAMGALPPIARAQPVPNPAPESAIDTVAAVLVAASNPIWTGQRVPRPAPMARPPGASLVVRSALRPLAVHADPAAARAPLAEDALAALEAAYDLMRVTGWDLPVSDGGRGDTDGFDLYLVDLPTDSYEARADGDLALSFEDSTVAFAVVDPDVDSTLFAACVTQAYVDASLLGVDPAEAPQWRRATSAWLAWMITGRFGCDEDEVARAMAEPGRAPIPDRAAREGAEGATDDGQPISGAGGAVWLALLDAYHSGGSGRFVREAWQFARQRTWEGHDLRGSPDLFQVMRAMFPRAAEKLEDVVEAVALSRWLAGTPVAPSRALLAIPRLAAPASKGPYTWAQLPIRARVDDRPLRSFGAGYVVIDTRGAPPRSSLRVWLRGEYGTSWSLVGVRMDGSGHVLSQLSTPPRRAPRSYLVLELMEATDHVLLVVSNLAPRLPDADSIDVNERGFELMVDRGMPP